MRVCGPGESLLAVSTLLRAAASLALLAACVAGRAEEPPAAQDTRSRVPAALKPRAFFAQMGIAKEVTAGTAGLIWNLGKDGLNERWSVYLEGSVGRWQSRGGYATDHGVLTQLALIPVVRHRFDEGRSPWFVEGGIGATVTSSVYRNLDKHFSTAFNFGDHVGAGYAFGPARKDEIVLRAEHFSNGGIKQPNPGQNFLELRYVHHFD
jgi:hypothetical protein